MEELAFTVNRDGFEFQYFRVSGAGGQHRDNDCSFVSMVIDNKRSEHKRNLCK